METVPDRIQKAIIKAVGDFPMKSICESGEQFNRYLKCRKPPMELSNIKSKMKEIEEMVLSNPAKFKLPKLPTDNNDEFAVKNFNSRKNQTVKEIAKTRVYSWQAINYDEHKALIYLVGRSAMEYAVVIKIFREIQRRDPEFTPTSFFDFGAGVGTGIWAASEMWKSSIYEYFLVDSSKYMNDLSDLLLRDGDANKALTLSNVYYRQFLPHQNDKFDIVLSAYTLFELPSLKDRLEVVNNLWNKSGKYLIFIETGTNAGFNVLNEVREFLMKIKEVNQQDAFIFSPCTHELLCPRYELNDGTPCNFEVIYNTLPFSGPQERKTELYSYLVIKKGSASESDRWPRIVRPTLERHRHVVCRMCTKEGKLQEGVFTAAKHGKLTYRCARASNWGDQLPMEIIDIYDEDEAEE